jgi:hypothetical protein
MIVGRKEDESGDGWILPQDNYDFMRIVQKKRQSQMLLSLSILQMLVFGV